MRFVLGVVVLLALSTAVLAADAQDQEQERPKWIQPESRHWPKWGRPLLRWLRAEKREAVRDVDDAVRELAVVKSWARTYVQNRVTGITTKANHRTLECKHFNRLFKIRADNVRFHHRAHRHRHHKRHSDKKHRAPWHKERRHSGKHYAWRKYSAHARMLLRSRDRLAAAKRARARCWNSVKRLRFRRTAVEKRARSTARAAVLRAKKHVETTKANLKKALAALKNHIRRIKARVAKYKTYYFHKCRRQKGHKYQCMYSIRHGGGDYSRLPHKFFKCLWQNSNAVVVRYVCYK